MRFDCPRKEFSDAVNAAATAAATRTTQSILQTLKIEATDSTIRVLGCDGEMWVERTIPAIVSEPGQVCLQARTLCDIVNSLADGDIEVKTTDGQGALLSQGASEYRLQTMDSSDFPEPVAVSTVEELTIPMKILREGIESVSYAVSSETHRQVLTGILLAYDGSKLSLVATDTHRLAVRTFQLPGDGKTMSAVVPERAMKAIKTLPIAEDSPVELRFGGGKLAVEVSGAKVVTQLLDGAYPNWERVVPSETTRSWSVETDQLEEKVKRTMILARDNANRVRFKGEQDQILISARSDEKGEAKEQVSMVANNGEVEMAFNGKYVQEALSAMPGVGVRIEMTENTRPAIFRPADDEQGYFCVIMPMQLS